MSFLGGMESMTYGMVPSFSKFEDAFDKEVSGTRYRVRNSPYDGDYTARELYALVKELADGDDEEQDFASSIMSTLGFEWV